MIEKTIRRVLRTAGRTGPPTACLDDEALAAYLDRSLGAAAMKAVEAHLAECGDCLEQVVLCTDPAVDPSAFPAFVGERSPLDVLVRFLRDTVEVVCGSLDVGLLPAPAPAAMRSAEAGQAALKCVRFGRSFGDLNVAVEVEATADGAGEIRVLPTREDVPVEDLRVTLLGDGRELDSCMARGGRVLFDEVRFGTYVIRLVRSGAAVGEVSLRLEQG